jgi:hypothetical protein
MKRRFLFLLIFLLFGPAPIALAEEESSAGVTYVTGSSLYIDAGREDGVTVSERLTVMRDGEKVAVVEVREVSSHRAVCTVVERILEPQVGDKVRFVPQASPPASPPPEATPTRRAPRRGAGFHGRVGLRYLWISDRLWGNGDLSQPAIDVALSAANMGGSPWSFVADFRARRTYRGAGIEDDARTRLYRLAVSRRGISDPWNLAVGRQYVAPVAAVGLFDGVSFEYSGKGWAAGAFTGTQPGPVDYGFSSDIRDHGVYATFQGKTAGRRSWLVTTGLIGSYVDSEVNREFVYIQGRFIGPKLTAFLIQEVDYNRDWKAEDGEEGFDPTNTFISVSYQATRVVGLHGGYDNRQNIRLYRDRETPITEFDDALRRGVWAGMSFNFARFYRLGIDARSSDGGTAGEVSSYTANFSASSLTSRNVNVNVRGTQYTRDQVEGWLFGMHAGLDLSRRVYFQVVGGIRDEDSPLALFPDTSIVWYGFDLDFDLGRRWYLTISAERSDGDLEQIDQVYTTVSYRF